MNDYEFRMKKMGKLKTMSGAINSRGQLTIPKKIRDAGGFEEGQEVYIIPLGDSIIITPKKIDLEEARRAMRKILRSSGVTPEELLAEMKEDRKKELLVSPESLRNFFQKSNEREEGVEPDREEHKKLIQAGYRPGHMS